MHHRQFANKHNIYCSYCIQTMCNFLSALHIGVSPSYYNKKADEWGQLYNERLLEQKQEDLVALKASLPDAEGAEDGNQCVPSQPAIDEPVCVLKLS